MYQFKHIIMVFFWFNIFYCLFVQTFLNILVSNIFDCLLAQTFFSVSWFLIYCRWWEKEYNLVYVCQSKAFSNSKTHQLNRNFYLSRQVFYWTHMLYVVFYVFLLMHGPIFYFFFLLPGVFFVVEKIGITLIMRKARYGRKIFIEKVNLLPSKVRERLRLKERGRQR